MKRSKNPADFAVMTQIERLLGSYGEAIDSVTYGRRATRNYACAIAFPESAGLAHILSDVTARNMSNVLIKTVDIDWHIDLQSERLVCVRVVAFGFGSHRLASVEQKIRASLLRSALQKVKWGVSRLP
jgi:hypothetical protein